MPDVHLGTSIGRLKRRADFLRVAKGKRWHSGPLTLQASRLDPQRDEVRIGFTLTRKVGGAVMRNRARRRLKEAVRLSPDLPVELGRDYVIIGREEALRVPFDRLQRELVDAIRGVTSAPPKPTRQTKPTRPERTRPGP